MVSKTYTTCAELLQSSFESLCGVYPFISESMNKRMASQYNDRWKRFKKRALKNVDYFGYGVSDEVIEELSYCLQPLSVREDDVLFTTGTQCKNIHIISEGEVSIYVNNNGIETFVDTLYTGCTMGAYSTLRGEPYAMIARAKTDCSLLTLSASKLNSVRDKFDELDRVMSEYDVYCEK